MINPMGSDEEDETKIRDASLPPTIEPGCDYYTLDDMRRGE